jgi:hypothetical protein
VDSIAIVAAVINLLGLGAGSWELGDGKSWLTGDGNFNGNDPLAK